MLSKTWKWASISIGAPLLGNMDGHFFLWAFLLQEFLLGPLEIGYHGSTVVKVLCCNSEGRWFDPSWCQWIFH